MNNTDITEFENQSGVGTAGLTGFVQGANKRYLPFQNGTSETKMITIPCQDQDIVTIKLLYFDTQGIICDGVFNLFINGSYLNFTGLSRGRESTLYYTYDSNNEVFRILIPQSSYAYCSARKASVDKTGVINNLSISDVFVENYNLAHWTELHINTAENTQYNNLTVIIDENDQEAIYDPHGILPTTIEKIKEAYHAEVADYCEVSNRFNENKTIQFFITGTDRLIGTLDTDFTSGEDNAGEVYLTLPAYSTWHYGTEVTENGTYVMNIPRGDYYLNTDTGDVYISLGNGLDIHGATTTSFDKIGSFRGPRGYAVNNIVLNNENESDPTVFITTSGDYNFYDMYVGEEGDSPEDSTYIGTFKVRNGVKGEQGDQGPRGEQGHPVFFTTTAPINITGADVGDYAVYTGTDDTFANIGDVFRLNSIDELTSTQIWQNTGGNIRGPKGDLLNAEGIIPAFRLVENPTEGSSQLQVSFDNVVWTTIGNLPSKGIVTVHEIVPTGVEGRYIYRIYYTDGTHYDMVFDLGNGRGGAIYEEGANIHIDEDTKEISAIGYTYTSSRNSFQEGDTGEALGTNSHSEGKDNVARGNSAHAEGLRRNAFGAFSHAEGASQSDAGSTLVETVEEEELTSFEAVGSSEPYQVDIQIGNGSVDPSITDYESILLFYQDGYVNPSDQAVITDYESNTEDNVTTITLTLDKKVADLHWSLDDGERITLCTPPQDKALSYGTFSHAEGFNTSSIGIGSHAEGDTTVALGDYAHAEGENCKALGDRSHAEGDNTEAYGFASHTEGKKTKAYYFQSHAEGNESKAMAKYSHAEGNKATASGESSHAEGYNTTASGGKSHAEGNGTTASGSTAHAEGSGSVAGGNVSHAEGKGTQTINEGEHAEGLWNQSFNNTVGYTISTVGVGGSDSTRKNARAILGDGKQYILNVGGYDGGAVTSSHLSIQDVIGHVGRYTTVLSSQASPINATYETYIHVSDSTFTAYIGDPVNTNKITTCSIVFKNTDSVVNTPQFRTVNSTATLMTNVEAIPVNGIAEYVATYIPTIGWLINGGSQRSTVSAAS